MNLHQYLDNPMGKGDASIPNRNAIKASLDDKYNTLISKFRIKYAVYKIKNTDDWYIHMEIPTESARTNSYDVVFKFTTDKPALKKEPNLSQYDIQLFSNSPSFTYTYASAYNNRDMLVDCLKSKFPKETFNIQSTVRNKYGIVNYEKYIYFGAKFILSHVGLNKMHLSTNAFVNNEVTLNVFKSKIRTSQEIELDYKKAKNELKFKQDHIGTPTKREIENGFVKPSEIKKSKASISNIKKTNGVRSISIKRTKSPKKIK